MKTILLLSFLFSSTLSFELSEELTQEINVLIKNELPLEKGNFKTEYVTAIIDDYLDAVLLNVKDAIIKSGMDPLDLPDQTVNIGIGKTTLSEGTLNDTSSITRYEDATVTYDNDSKQIHLEFILRFQDLKFIYKYHTKVTFISITGHLHGDVEHVKVHVKLGFDFANYNVFVDSIDFKHTGDITIWVSGNSAIDWITNAMSKILTSILHNVIIDQIKRVIDNPIHSIVDAINQLINGFLHPSTQF